MEAALTENMRDFFGAWSNLRSHVLTWDEETHMDDAVKDLERKVRKHQRDRDAFSDPEMKNRYATLIEKMQDCSALLHEVNDKYELSIDFFERTKEKITEDWQVSVDEVLKRNEAQQNFLNSIQEEYIKNFVLTYETDLSGPQLELINTRYCARLMSLYIAIMTTITYKVVPKILLAKFVKVEPDINYGNLLSEIIKFGVDLTPVGTLATLVSFAINSVRGEDLLRQMDEEIKNVKQFDEFLTAWLSYTRICVRVIDGSMNENIY